MVSPALFLVVVAGLVDAHHVAVLFADFLKLHPRTAEWWTVTEAGSRSLGERRFAFAANDVFGDVFKCLGNVVVLLDKQ